MSYLYFNKVMLSIGLNVKCDADYIGKTIQETGGTFCTSCGIYGWPIPLTFELLLQSQFTICKISIHIGLATQTNECCMQNSKQNTLCHIRGLGDNRISLKPMFTRPLRLFGEYGE